MLLPPDTNNLKINFREPASMAADPTTQSPNFGAKSHKGNYEALVNRREYGSINRLV